jgi:hypothetical protein
MLIGQSGLGVFSLVMKMNGIASGPKTAPIMAQNRVFTSLLSAMNQRRIAHAMQFVEMLI